MSDRYFKVETASRFVVAITVGPSSSPGHDAVLQAPDNRHVGIGWSLVDGEFTDTTVAYKSHLAAIRDFGSQSFLTSIPET